MVSFQCHGCGDVVKKPKLDQHRSRCHTGFDCIDCSTTFNTPGEYKGHTSCISEAEKYQKSLYKGPKTGAQVKGKQPDRSQPTATSTSTPAAVASTDETSIGRASNAQWNRGPQASPNPSNGAPNGHQMNGRNGYGNGNGRGWNQRGYSKATSSGANDTPLGTPTARASPVEDPTSAPIAPAPSDAALKTPVGNEVIYVDGKPVKKRKWGAVEEAAKAVNPPPKTKKVKVSDISVPTEESPKQGKAKEKGEKSGHEKKEKKEKKEKVKEKKAKDMDVEMAVATPEATVTIDEDEEKRKRKAERRAKKQAEKEKETATASQEAEAGTTENTKVEKAAKKHKKANVEDAGSVVKSEKERKKKGKDGEESSGKEEKKRKREKERDAEAVDTGTTTVEGEGTSEQTKKRKRKDGFETVKVLVEEIAEGKKEKKVKDGKTVEEVASSGEKKEKKSKKQKKDKLEKSTAIAVS